MKNGYHQLRGRLHSAGFHFIRVKWRWGLQFAMWIVVPGEHLTMLREDLDMHCSALSHHLVRQGCRESLSHPSVEVSID